MKTPIVHAIDYQDPWEVFTLFEQDHSSVFLDSAQQKTDCGRYSFIAIEPFMILKSKNNIIYKNDVVLHGNPFDILEHELNQYRLNTIKDLPPFQGGVVGYFGYELFQHLEKIPLSWSDDMNFPDLMLGFYDVVIAFDILEKKSWIFSSGFPYHEEKKQLNHAKLRLEYVINRLNSSVVKIKRSDVFCNPEEISSNFTREEYCLSVQKVIDYILAGDIFEANLSQRFMTKLPGDLSALELYERLRTFNSSTFSAYLNFSDIKILSASPERFIKLNHGIVETRPIKGTRRRSHLSQEDKDLAFELLHSEKDRAENIMIVDLLRNDLSRVCMDHSVKVLQLCGLESYATVHHLVSVIHGQLRKSLTSIDLLRASYPGGSITGAPKIRAMEIISELEPTLRGPYCGSIGYIGFDGNMDSSITIRTFSIKDDVITFQVGGAVVADSSPLQEYDETLTKARALFKVLAGKLI